MNEITAEDYINDYRGMNEIDDLTMVFLEKYNKNEDKLIETSIVDSKIIEMYASGLTKICFPSGVRRESYPDGYLVIYFDNKDIR